MSSDLWGDLDINEYENNDAISILRAQATVIGKKTDGRVKATFSKSPRVNTNLENALYKTATAINEIAKQYSADSYEDDELSTKKDINSLFNYSQYRFEIYNYTYRFRIFTLKNRELFPIEIIPDEGISEELGISKVLVIDSNEALERNVRQIFSCKKVQRVLSKMFEQAKETELQIMNLINQEKIKDPTELSIKTNINESEVKKIIQRFNL